MRIILMVIKIIVGKCFYYHQSQIVAPAPPMLICLCYCKTAFCTEAALSFSHTAMHMCSNPAHEKMGQKHYFNQLTRSQALMLENLLFIFQLKDEILSCYQQIKTLCSQLRQRPRRNSNESVETSSSSEADVIHTDSLRKEALNGAVIELKGLVHDLLRKEAKGACLSCGADSNEKIRLEVQLHKTTEANEKMERRLKELEDLSKRKDDEILDVKSKVPM